MFGKTKQQIDGKVNRALSYVGESFVSKFGKALQSDGDLVFSKYPKQLSSVRLAYRKKDYLFGGLYNLHLCGEVLSEDKGFRTGSVKMGYHGIMFKGDAFFKGDEQISSLLNEDHQLIKKLSELDLYSGEVVFSEDRAVVTLVPMGGSYTYTIFPPSNYGGILKAESAERLAEALAVLASRLKKINELM